MSRDRFDVVVVGEVLVELYADRELTEGAPLRLGFSGDALNSAAAAAAAGARTAVLTAVGDDELGAAILDRLRHFGIATDLVLPRARPNGAYLVHGDLSGHRQFLYWRTGSAASTLDDSDLDPVAEALCGAGSVVLSGVGAALSESSERAILAAARLADGRVVYDPNFRPRLTTPERARRVLAAVAGRCALVTPSCPGDTGALLDTVDPDRAADDALRLGARAVAVTSGSSSVHVAVAGPEGATRCVVPVPANPDAVDATGAGDVFTGTAAARLALGDPLDDAVRLAVGAASLSVAGRGGTGLIPTLTATRAAAPVL